MANRRLGYALAAMATILAVSACTGQDRSLQPTVTKEQAAQRTEQLVQEAFAQLPAGATLKLNNSSDESPCDDASDGGPAGRVFVERRYLVVPPPGGTWPVDQALPTLVSFWEKKGYKVYDDRRTSSYPKYVVETPDGYSANITTWDRGDHSDITLSSSSPCVWPNGTPQPQ